MVHFKDLFVLLQSHAMHNISSLKESSCWCSMPWLERWVESFHWKHFFKSTRAHFKNFAHGRKQVNANVFASDLLNLNWIIFDWNWLYRSVHLVCIIVKKTLRSISMNSAQFSFTPMEDIFVSICLTYINIRMSWSICVY